MDPFIILSVIGGLSSVASGVQQYSAGKDQKKALAAQRRIDQIRNLEERRARMRQAFAAQASVRNASAQMGTQGSSGEAGAISSVASQVGSAIAFSKATERQSMRVNRLEQSAADKMTLASTFSSVANLAFKGASLVSPTPPPASVKADGTFGRGLGVLKRP